MSDEVKLLIELLSQAVLSVYQEKRFLLAYEGQEREGLEQAFVFRVGIRLNELLKGTDYETFDLDSEYNKNMNDTKSTLRFPNGIRPDLLLHERNTNDKNKMVVEFKGHWNMTEKAVHDDFMKLEDLTEFDSGYEYLVGVFVCINQDKPIFSYFVDGKSVKR